jgi:hypothetical protein
VIDISAAPHIMSDTPLLIDLGFEPGSGGVTLPLTLQQSYGFSETTESQTKSTDYVDNSTQMDPLLEAAAHELMIKMVETTLEEVVQAYIKTRLANLLPQAEATMRTILREEQGMPEKVEDERMPEATKASEASETCETDCRDGLENKTASITLTEAPASDIGPHRPRYSYGEIIRYFHASVPPKHAEDFNSPEMFATTYSEHILKLILVPHDVNPQWDSQNMFSLNQNIRILPIYAFNFEIMRKAAEKVGEWGQAGVSNNGIPPRRMPMNGMLSRQSVIDFILPDTDYMSTKAAGYAPGPTGCVAVFKGIAPAHGLQSGVEKETAFVFAGWFEVQKLHCYSVDLEFWPSCWRGKRKQNQRRWRVQNGSVIGIASRKHG